MFSKAIRITQHKNNNQKKKQNEKLPTITLKYGDEVIGKLDGYTMAMDESLMRDVIVPISTSHKVPMAIKTQGNRIKTVKYEVKNTTTIVLLIMVQLKIGKKMEELLI